MKASPKHIALFCVGNNSLDGSREDEHLSFISKSLTHYGLSLSEYHVLRDDADLVIAVVRAAWQRADMVILVNDWRSTSQDYPHALISGIFDLPLVFHPAMENALRLRHQIQGDLSLPLKKQCYCPQGFIALANTQSAALGLFYTEQNKCFFALPDCFEELSVLLTDNVLPRLLEYGWTDGSSPTLQVQITGLAELEVEQLLRRKIYNRYPDLIADFASAHGIVDLRLRKGESNIPNKDLALIGNQLQTDLGDHFVCFGHCSLGKIIINQLRKLNKSISIAESCTGGLLSDAFVSIPGASEVFKGGVVCYTNESKMEMLEAPEALVNQQGAVSAEVAMALATGSAKRFRSDYALSVTGLAGPTGGTSAVPVGTVYFGYYTPDHVQSHKAIFKGERQTIRACAVNEALDFMRRKLNNHSVIDS